MMAYRHLALLACLAATPAAAQEPTSARSVPSITVSGQASVPVVPDSVLVSIGVATERPRAADAAAENNRTAADLMDVVKAAGIEPRDVQTSSVALAPVYDNNAPDEAPKLTGYRASLTLQIRVKPVDKAGALVGALTDKGANTIDGIDFIVSPDPKRDDQLHADAMRDAKHAAEVYVGALGLKLGRVLDIAPVEVSEAEPRHYAMRAKAAAAPVPLAAGEQQQVSRVSVTFEILQ